MLLTLIEFNVHCLFLFIYYSFAEGQGFYGDPNINYNPQLPNLYDAGPSNNLGFGLPTDPFQTGNY